jgi:glycosyltransferase involved in cell wall biosynthesis
MIANSEFVRGRLVRDGYPAERIRVILNPAPDPGPVSPTNASGEVRFLFLGRIVPQKGLDWLLEALAATAGSWHLDVCGSGPDEAAARELATRLKLDGRVHFHGWLPAEAVADRIAGCRAVIVPSVWHEPAGLSAVEAAAAGRAVIASRTGGLPEVVEDTVTGLLVAPRSRGLTAAIDQLGTDPAMAARMGEAGRAAANDRFSLGRHLDLLVAAYEDALASPVS